MRRSICYVEPAIGLAGQKCTWQFVYTPASTLPKGTVLRFDLGSKGRAIDWEIPSTNVKDDSNVIWAVLENGKVIVPKAIQLKNQVVPSFDFTLPQDVPAGKTVIIAMGTRKGEDEEDGNSAQLVLQRRRPFNLYIDTSGKGHFGEAETFTVDIKGNVLKTIKIIVPSFVTKNRRFDIILRFEDEFGNLTSNAPDDTLIELSHGNLRENLKWKLFVPETGFIALPNLYFNEPGIYTIELKNVATGDIYRSSPIRCSGTETRQLFWGSLHGESERYDSSEHIDSCLRHFRDEKSLNFYGTSHFDSPQETSNELWKTTCQTIAELDEDDRYAAILGQQYTGDPKTEGSRIFVYPKDERPIIRRDDVRTSSLQKIYKLYTPKELLSVITFSMGKGNEFNFKEWDAEHERLAEIYNAWGSSEKSAKDGNSRPIECSDKKGYSEAYEGALLTALVNNKRIGFVAGGLDDRGIYSDLYASDQAQYTPGLTAVMAESMNRAAIIEALYNRHCYATTGERIIISFTLAGSIMGTELSTADKPGLHVNRHIEGIVAGTSKIIAVQLIRNGEPLMTYEPEAENFQFEYDDLTPLAKVSLDGHNGKPPFTFYYLRVLQEDGHIGWSSPIWVDCHPQVKNAQVKNTIAKTIPAKKQKKD